MNILSSIISRRKLITDIVIAISIGVIYSFICLFSLILRDYAASDFQFSLEAARALISGMNPYQVVVPTGPYPYNHYYYYSIFAALFSIPFTLLPDQLAGAAFIGITSGFLAYGLAKKERWRLGIFLSAPAFVTIYTAQWSFLIAGCLLMPEFQILLLSKPNIGLAAYTYRISRKGIIISIIGLIISFIIFPYWIKDWINALRHTTEHHIPPAISLILIGFFICLTQLRRPEGRLLSIMLITPQAKFFYDQLILWFIPSNPYELWMLNIFSWIGYLAWRIPLLGVSDTGRYVPEAYRYVIWLIYFPAIIILFLPKIFPRLFILIKRLPLIKGYK